MDKNTLKKEIKNCNKCKLIESCTQTVGWHGNPESPLWFVGEAPGYYEDLQGIPLVGKSGQLLNKMLRNIGLGRDQVNTTNIVKCRPLNNRTPVKSEADFCAQEWLEKEIELFRPKVIVALGAVAMKYFGDENMKISKLAGTTFEYKGIKIIPVFHPSYILRQHSEELEKRVTEQIKKAAETAGLI